MDISILLTSHAFMRTRTFTEGERGEERERERARESEREGERGGEREREGGRGRERERDETIPVNSIKKSYALTRL